MNRAIPLPKPQLQSVRAGITKLVGGAILALTMLVGCASVPEAPDGALQAAEQAIRTAEQARVADYASVELAEARDKLSSARSAVQNEEMTRARHLAEQARLHADLATAKAESARTKEANDEIRDGINAMKQEMQRGTGGRP